MSDSPKKWSRVSIGDLLADVRSGFACGEDLEEGVIQIRMNNVTKDGGIDWSKIRRVPKDSKNLNDYQVAPNDILFNHTNSPDLVGKCAVFRGFGEVVSLLYESPYTDLNPLGVEGLFKAGEIQTLFGVLDEIRQRAVA